MICFNKARLKRWISAIARTRNEPRPLRKRYQKNVLGKENSYSKALAKRGNLLPEAFAANTPFLDVSQFCHTGNIASVSKNVSAVKQKHILLLETVICLWQKWETLRKHVSAENVFGNLFPRFARA